MKKPITPADFLLPITEEEDGLQISNCNQISRVGLPPFPDSEDSNDKFGPLTMPPPMEDDDYQDSDRESNPDEKDYLSDEMLNENGFIIDPFFYRENILR